MSIEPTNENSYIGVEPPKGTWTSLEISKLLVSLLTPIVVVGLGFIVTQMFRDADDARDKAARQIQNTQKQLEEAKQQSQTRQTAVGNFSRAIYERRTRSELMLSALKRNAENPTDESKKELLERKRLYDEAYFNWNVGAQANLLLVRQILGADHYTAFENIVEVRLVNQTFSPLDNCITRAYDLAIRGKDSRPTLEECQAKRLLQRVLDCGYAITDELFKLSSPSGQTKDAIGIVDNRCPNDPQGSKAQLR